MVNNEAARIVQGLRMDTPRLVLRAVAPEDRELLFGIVADPGIMRYMHGAMTPEAAETLFAQLRDPASGLRSWIAEERGTGVPCAHACLKPPASPKDTGLELVYVVLPGFQRRGIAVEMMGRLAAYAFGALDVPQLVATVDVDHVASQRVALRLGFVEKRRDTDADGPVVVFTLTRAAWEARA